jgi:hypothetical protein
MLSQTKERQPVLSVLGCTNRVWFDLLKRYGFDTAHFHRVVLGTLVTILLTPFRWYERIKLGNAIDQCQIHDSPVFILGHWRSGTTLLHNILSRDQQFGFVTYSHGLFPHCFQTNRLISFFVQKVMPGTRPMDNMEIDMNKPQEEEQALIALSGHSLYNMWICPSQQLTCWTRYGLLDDSNTRKKWSYGYTRLLKAATHHSGGKRLLLKNPANTARIPYLLGEFPNARFIYIYRNPYAVYESTKHLYRKVSPYFRLSRTDINSEDENIARIYREMIESYHANRHLIPATQLIEIRYEDFVENQKSTIESVYEKLDLGDFRKVEPCINDYLDSIKDYKPNNLRPSPQSIELVNKQLSSVFFHYTYPKTTASREPVHV